MSSATAVEGAASAAAVDETAIDAAEAVCGLASVASAGRASTVEKNRIAKTVERMTAAIANTRTRRLRAFSSTRGAITKFGVVTPAGASALIVGADSSAGSCTAPSLSSSPEESVVTLDICSSISAFVSARRSAKSSVTKPPTSRGRTASPMRFSLLEVGLEFCGRTITVVGLPRERLHAYLLEARRHVGIERAGRRDRARREPMHDVDVGLSHPQGLAARDLPKNGTHRKYVRPTIRLLAQHALSRDVANLSFDDPGLRLRLHSDRLRDSEVEDFDLTVERHENVVR